MYQVFFVVNQLSKETTTKRQGGGGEGGKGNKVVTNETNDIESMTRKCIDYDAVSSKASLSVCRAQFNTSTKTKSINVISLLGL